MIRPIKDECWAWISISLLGLSIPSLGIDDRGAMIRALQIELPGILYILALT